MTFISVKIVQKGLTFNDMENLINSKVEATEKGIKNLGEATAQNMKQNIEASTLRKPSTGTLADSIKTYYFSDPQKSTLGVGLFDDLPIYWYVMNYGATVSGTPFVPGMGKTVGGDFGGDRPNPSYQGTPGGGGVRFNHPGAHAMRAFLVVTPKNYIEKTLFWLQSKWIGNLLNA